MARQQRTSTLAASVQLPLLGMLAIYTRVPEPDEREDAQALTPLDDLKQYGLVLGFQDESIIVFDHKSDLSDRPDPALLQAIARGSPQAVPVANEQQLFREADAFHVNSFIQLCVEHRVLVLTPHMIYDFTNPSLVTLFRFKCVEGSQVAEQVSRKTRATQ